MPVKKISSLIDTCYRKSLELLEKNSTRCGVLAGSPSPRARQRNYLSVFGRDASICALGMAASGRPELVKTAERSLATLAKFQAENGQIPNYVKPEAGVVDFWYTGCIDATLWWLIAVEFYDRYSRNKTKLRTRLSARIKRALNWLSCQEHQSFFLLTQGEASDWADIYPRAGLVLYSNTLWYRVKSLYHLKKTGETRQSFNYIFGGQSAPKSLMRTNRRLARLAAVAARAARLDRHLSYVNYTTIGADTDVYGNALAIIFGLPNKRFAGKIAAYLSHRQDKNDLPIPALFDPIKKNSRLWRGYMNEHKQNLPYQYHNGGIWPFIGCFWAMALAKAGRGQEAWNELEFTARANSLNNWRFNEWFHAKTGKPMGMPGQSWNAGAFLLAYHYMKGDIGL